MKKFISLVLALVMALSLTTIAWGATVEVNDYTTFTGAIADGNEIKLTADIEVTTGFTIPANTTVTIDLNGFKLYAGDASHTFNAAFTMITNKGTLTIKDGSTAKTGKIELAGEIHDANYATYGFPTIAINAITNGGTLTLESGTISVTADKDATTPKVATYAVDNNSGTGNAILNINGGALINEHNVAIRQFCNSTTYKNEVNITAGEVTGTRAVWIQLPSSNSALEQKAALNVEGGTLTATGTSDGYNLAVYSYSYGASSTATEINISGGTFEGDVAIGGGAKNGSETMNITGGTFEGEVYTYNTDTTETAGKLEISGGTFAVAPSQDYLPTGMTTIQTTDGTYVLGTVPALGDKFDLYLANADMNTALKLKTPTVAGLSFDEKAAKTNKDGSGNVAYIAANNGQYFVKTTNPTVADYAVTDAGKTTVLYYVTVAGTSAANFEYAEAVSAFTKFSTYAKCDYVTGTPVAGETYFMAADGNVYMAAAAGTGTNYLLNGKVVSGILVGAPEDHVFTLNGYKYDTTLKQNVPTSALCTKCMMNTSSIYPIAKVPATYTLYPTNGEGSNAYTVALPSAAAVVTPSTPAGDKIESAETFDAGIAMYVGMSVMAAAGSAVVLKKKD